MLYNIPIDASKSLIKYVKKRIGKLKEQEEIERKLEEEKFNALTDFLIQLRSPTKGPSLPRKKNEFLGDVVESCKKFRHLIGKPSNDIEIMLLDICKIIETRSNKVIRLPKGLKWTEWDDLIKEFNAASIELEKFFEE